MHSQTLGHVSSETSKRAQQFLSRLARIVPGLVAALLGVVIVIGVGFAGPDVIHQAAHDSRHSLNFPCH
jgi:cobalt transporter subunit CbtB